MEMVKEFPYLGSTIISDGKVDTNVKIRIAKAVSAFGSFTQSLSVDDKFAVYKAVVLAILLYGSECWAVKAYHICQLDH